MSILNIQWPFPQIFRGGRKTLVLDKNAVYEIDEDDYLIKAPLMLYDAYGDDIGVDYLTNGGFTGSATGWTLGTGWAYSANKIVHTPGNTASATQISTAMDTTPEDGEYYTAILYISVTAGSITLSLGTYETTEIFASGKYRVPITCSGGLDIAINPSSDFDGYVDLIGLYHTNGAIVTGGPWNFIDLSDSSWVALNGESIVFTRGNNVITENSITINTSCAHSGRVLFGGFDESNFWNSDWQTYWTSAITAASLDMGMFSNTVYWTGIGRGAANLHSLIYPSDITSGTFPLIMDSLQQGDSGFITMKWRGRVWAIKPLGKGVVVYGDSGITYLSPMIEPIPTYGRIEIADTGIISRCAVAGDIDKDGVTKEHIFINSSGQLCRLTTDLKITVLDYQEYMQMLKQDPDVIIVYDPINREYNISNGSMAFVLNEHSIYESTIAITSLVNINGVPCAIYDYLIDEYDKLIWKTEEFNLGIPGNKTFTWVEIVYEGITNLQVAAEFQVGNRFVTGPRKPINKDGLVRVQLQGDFVRIALYGTRTDRTQITSVAVKAQTNDKRYIRGIYADQVTS